MTTRSRRQSGCSNVATSNSDTLDAHIDPDTPVTDDERALVGTIECDGVCGRTVYEAATIDVVAGEVIGRWRDPEYHVGVTGTDARSPVHERYCLQCAETAGFDITKPAGERAVSETNTYLTPSNLASALVGGTAVALLFLLFV